MGMPKNLNTDAKRIFATHYELSEEIKDPENAERMIGDILTLLEFLRQQSSEHLICSLCFLGYGILQPNVSEICTVTNPK